MRFLAFLVLKMRQNRWFTLGTLLGLTVAAAFAMSIPMYADGTLKRLVGAVLQERTKGLPPASLYLIYQTDGSGDQDLEGLDQVNRWIADALPGRIGFPVLGSSFRLSLAPTAVRSADPEGGGGSRLVRMELASQGGVPEKLELTGGRWPHDGMADGILETAVLDETMSRYGWNVGDTFNYDAKDEDGKTVRLTLRIAGSYKLKDEEDLSWAIDGKEKLSASFLVTERTMEETLLRGSRIRLDSAGWFYAFDVQQIRISDLARVRGELERLEMRLHGMLENTKVNLTFENMLRELERQSVLLQALLFALAAPVLAMVLYFITLNARLSLNRQRSDISVLQSRGASPRQILALYALEAALLGAAAMAAGIGFAWFMAKTIGSASGFLTFVGRKSIPVGITWTAWLSGGLATLLAVFATAAPIRGYARVSVVQAVRERARTEILPAWQRYYLDAALLAAAAAGWFLLDTGTIAAARDYGGATAIEPVIFILPALGIFAAGLLFLRMFPHILRLFGKLLNNRLPVAIYLTLTQLSRSATSFHPIMILLILTIGLGVYNASAARTMDLNETDRVQYQYGSDVVLKAAWEGVTDEEDANIIYYTEPPFGAYRDLAGVRSAARVMRATGSIEAAGRTVGSGQIIGIDNADFYRTAWFRDDLFPHPPYRYLDALGAAEQAALVSEQFAARHGLKPGDPFRMKIGYGNEPVDFVVVGLVPYWPSLYPDESPFVIANLDYVYQQIEKIPYEVWLDLEDGARLAPILETLAERGIAVTQADDARSMLIERRNHPSHGGVFGILSLGFLLSLLVSLLGYLIFWFFSLSRRTVQLGILRATGLTRRQLTGMLLLEQLFTTGLSVAAGIGLGTAASRLFLPFMQSGSLESRQVPPYLVVFGAEDTMKLYIAAGIMLAAGACILILQLRRLRISQAVKLGEER